LTRGANPSRFSFLQAGLMTTADELAAIQDLQAKPPRWVAYWDVPPERYLLTSPSADPARLRFPAMEEYLKANYHEVEARKHWHGPYSVLERCVNNGAEKEIQCPERGSEAGPRAGGNGSGGPAH